MRGEGQLRLFEVVVKSLFQTLRGFALLLTKVGRNPA